VATQWTLFDDPEFLARHAITLDGQRQEIELSIPQIRCAACTWLIERVLSTIDGVQASHAHLGRQTLTIRWNQATSPLSEILARIDQLGYTATLLTDEGAYQARKQARKVMLKRIGVAAIGAMQVMMFATALYVGDASFIEADQRAFLRWVSLLVSIPVMLYSAQPFFLGAYRDLKNRTLGMDVPVALALALAWSASIFATITGIGEVFFDSVSMFTLFLLTGRYLELTARHNVLDTPVESRPMPMTMSRVEADGTIEQVPVSSLQHGDLVQLSAGQQAPVDLVLVSGSGAVDTQALTGEFEPHAVEAGDEILAGSVNGSMTLQCRVERIGQNAFLGKLEHLARQAEQVQTPEARWTEPLIRWFIAAVLTASAVTYLGWFSVDSERAFEYALSVLVVTCPCALSLAIPTAWTVTIRTLRQQGILLLNPVHLLAFAKSTHWIFDKTGTLTEGQFRRFGVRRLEPSWSEADVLGCLSGLEQSSPHPIAQAFRDIPPWPVEDVTHHPGRGVEGTFQGDHYSIRRATDDERIDAYPQALTITLEHNAKPIASVALEDGFRPNAGAAIRKLTEAGIKITLLSGDQSARVANAADALGITAYLGEQTPEDKLAFVNTCDESVVMVGDGLNDAPVLASANGSVTFAQASDLTRLSAGAVLLSPSLEALISLKNTAMRTRRIIRQSFFWVLVYNVVAVPFAMAGFVPPWLAAIGMSASSIFVIVNALRLKKLS
jgi:Cu2+-exporting ATPase